MVNEIKASAEQLVDRIKNPFIGAFVLCTLAINWSLVFLLFNFDKDCNFNDKLTLIDNYLAIHVGKNFWDRGINIFLLPACYATFLLSFYSIGKLVFASIIKTYNSHIEPYILRRLEKGGYEPIENVNVLSEKNRNLHTEIIKMRTENSNLNTEIIKLRGDLANMEQKFNTADLRLKELNALDNVLTTYKNEEEGSKLLNLEIVMAGIWKREEASETFYVRENQEMRSGSAFAAFRNVYYNHKKNYLFFERVLLKDGFIKQNHLIEVNSNTFVGVEIGGTTKESVTYKKQ